MEAKKAPLNKGSQRRVFVDAVFNRENSPPGFAPYRDLAGNLLGSFCKKCDSMIQSGTYQIGGDSSS